MGDILPKFNAIIAKSSDLGLLLYLLFAVVPSIECGVLSDIVSNVVPKHMKPLSDDELGYYLAGYFDGNGYGIIGPGIFQINFKDGFLAYSLLERLGFGTVTFVGGRKGYVYSVRDKKSILTILNLINGKIRSESRFNQIVDLLAMPTYKKENINFTMDTSDDINNYWFAGFLDAVGYFRIIVTQGKRNTPSVGLRLCISQNNDFILKLIQKWFGGSLRTKKKEYTLEFISLICAKKLILQLDKYQMQSLKYLCYLRWRKAYLLMRDKNHLSKIGYKKLLYLKSIINKDNHRDKYKDEDKDS